MLTAAITLAETRSMLADPFSLPGRFIAENRTWKVTDVNLTAELMQSEGE